MSVIEILATAFGSFLLYLWTRSQLPIIVGTFRGEDDSPPTASPTLLPVARVVRSGCLMSAPERSQKGV